MALFNRYDRDSIKANRFRQTNFTYAQVYWGAKFGTLTVTTRQSKPGERLDIIAGDVYGDSSCWWIIAAASGIGWGLQIPGGIVLKIPSDLNQLRLLFD